MSGLSRSLRRIKFLAHAEILHLVRDKATLAQIIVMPLVQLLVLSNVATFRVRETPAYVVDFDHSETSRGVVSRLAASGLFRIVGASGSAAAANAAMLGGRATLVLTIPTDFEASLVRTGVGTVQLDLNAEKGAAAGIVQSYAAQVFDAYARELAPRMARRARATGRIDVRARGWYNAPLNYQHYMVPGLLVALVTMVGTLLAAQNVAREKEVGTLEQLNATPITRTEFIAGKLAPLWVLGLLDLTLGLVVARLVFGVPMRGSLLLLFGAASLYLVVALSIGLWISTLVETQQQAMFVTFFILMIYLLMSGLLTPIDSMPPWVQTVSLVNPTRHFVAISRAILVKGAGLGEILVPLGALVAIGAVTLPMAVRQYAKRAG
jgi:ABC-2 type transport system permease protein